MANESYSTFTIIIKDQSYETEVDGDDEQDYGEVKIVREMEGRKRVIYIILPVHGGYVVTEIGVTSKRKKYTLEIRKVAQKTKRSLKNSTILKYYADGAKAGDLLDVMAVEKEFHGKILVGKEEWPISISGSNEAEDAELNAAFKDIKLVVRTPTPLFHEMNKTLK